MTLTFLGNRYESEAPVITNGTATCVTGKYRGIEYRTTTTSVPIAAICDRKYRGIRY